MTEKKEQLSMTMGREQALELPDVGPPEGYVVRGHQPGDGPAWIALLEHGSFSEWSLERFDSYMQGRERIEGSCVAVKGGSLVAATFASVQDDDTDVGRLDFVVSHPEHRGNGLGRVVCTVVMKHLARRGFETTVLFTDDWRLPAIGLYLSLGFKPRMTAPGMPGRWKAVRQKLSENRH